MQGGRETERRDCRGGDVGSKRKPSAPSAAQVAWVERGMLMSSKRPELPEQCFREHRGTTSLNHPASPGR